MENNCDFEIISKKYAIIPDIEDDMDGPWIEASLFVIHNGKKSGLMYNKNDWIENAPKEYIILLNCEWDHIDILNTSYGDYVIAYSKGKCRCFFLRGCKEILEETSTENIFSILFTVSNVGDNWYDSVRCEGKSSKLLIFEKNNRKQYYNLETDEMSCPYDLLEVVSEEFIVYYNFQDDQGGCVNFVSGICFPEIHNFRAMYKCEYTDGIVFSIYHHNMEELLSQEYLLFYSATLNCFFKTNIFTKINIFGISSDWSYFEMLGFEGISESCDITYRAFGNCWSDKDIERIDDIQKCE